MHRNDPAILTRWLGNKTTEIFVSWIRQSDNSLLVAVEDDNILGVSSVTDAGNITLNYVSPDARFRGVSRAMLRALETRASERCNRRCRLISTETARRFYRANGYTKDGSPSPYSAPVPVIRCSSSSCRIILESMLRSEVQSTP